MPCICKIFNTEATIGSTLVLQFHLKDDAGTVINITSYRVAMTAKSKGGAVLFTADSDGDEITLDAEDGATIQVTIGENIAPQDADYNVLIQDEDGNNVPVIRGTLKLLPQITDLIP